MQKQVIQTQKMAALGTLAGGIAHDFNNILFPIMGLSEMLLDDLSEGSDARGMVSEIYTAAQRAADLVQQIVSFSRQGEQKKRPVRVQYLLKEMIKLSRAAIPASIKIDQDIEGNCGAVLADPALLHQVILNLITAACDAAGNRGGEIAIRLEEVFLTQNDVGESPLKPGKHAVLCVRYKTSGATSQTKQDLGGDPGLAAVGQIVADHGGAVHIFGGSQEGAGVSVYLPVHERRDGQKNPEPKGLHGNAESILVVDDEEMVIKVEEQMLRRSGFKVTALTSSVQALAVVKNNPRDYDAVISDMAMPDLSGDALARELKSIRADLPVILCTGFNDTLNPEKIEATGIDGILTKPVIRSEMLRMIGAVLKQAKGTTCC